MRHIQPSHLTIYQAVACVSAIALAAGAMYIAQKESKSTEGDKSIFYDREFDFVSFEFDAVSF